MTHPLFLQLVTSLVFVFTPPRTLSKSELMNLKCIYELSADLPTDIKVYTMTIAARKGQEQIQFGTDEYVSLSEIIPSGCDVNQKARDFLTQIDAPQKIYFDIRYQRAEESFTRVMALAVYVTE